MTIGTARCEVKLCMSGVFRVSTSECISPQHMALSCLPPTTTPAPTLSTASLEVPLASLCLKHNFFLLNALWRGGQAAH